MEIRFYDETHLANLLGVDRRIFHRTIKPQIIKDFPEILMKLHVDNPDIGLDENNVIHLADHSHTKILPTQLTIFDYQN